MQTIASTASVPRAEAFDYYREATRSALTSHETETFDRAGFYGEMQIGTVVDLTIGRWWCSPGITRIGKGENDIVSLVLPSTRVQFESNGQCVEINHDTLGLVDARLPFAARSLGPSDRTVVTIPPAELNRRIRFNKDILNRPIAVAADGRLLVAQVHALISINPSTLSPVAAARLREHLLDLIALAFSPACGELPRLGVASRIVELRLRAAVEAQLANPDADRGSIAAAAGVSERHADRVLAQDGRSVRSLLLERRLEKCREALEQGDDRKIYEIALQHGFTDTPHFSRAFKERFGRTPGDCRP